MEVVLIVPLVRKAHSMGDLARELYAQGDKYYILRASVWNVLIIINQISMERIACKMIAVNSNSLVYTVLVNNAQSIPNSLHSIKSIVNLRYVTMNKS